MNDEQIKHLINLSDRAINTRVLHEQGLANIVIFKAEYNALEEAIEELQLKRTHEARLGEGEDNV